MEREIVYFDNTPSELVKAEDTYLSNYEIAPIIVNGLEYKTNEHYFQANKFSGADLEAVRQAPTPDESKKIAWTLPLDRTEWEERKEAVMMQGLLYKFEQHPALLEKLLRTGNSRIVEESDSDMYWGGTLPGSKNRLGEMLEEIREKHLKNN